MTSTEPETTEIDETTGEPVSTIEPTPTPSPAPAALTVTAISAGSLPPAGRGTPPEQCCYALASDGSVWYLTLDNVGKWTWTKLPNIPQS